MSSTQQLQRRPRRLVPVMVIVLGLLLISVVMIQQVVAQDSGSLKPPFKLNRNSSASSFDLPGPVSLPLAGPIIMSQTFNSTYAPIVDLNQLGWHESYASGATSQYTWKYVGTAPLPNTVWSAGSSLQNPATGTYTKGMQALLIYGPLNLTEYTQLVMTGTYWLDTAPGDYLGLAYSTDGTNWDELYAHSAADPGLTRSQIFYASLNQVARKPMVWIALTFVSNDDNLVGRGAFVKDVVLRGNPILKFYLPLMRVDLTPTPTATPQVAYVYNYTFGSGLNTDPDFLKWGGQMDYDCGTDCQVIQGVSTNGNPSGAINFSMGGLQVIAGTSPNHTIPANFELTADLMLVEGKANARFGLIFGASNSTFYVDNDGFIKMDAARNYYKFDLNIDPNNESAITQYRLQRYDNGAATNLQSGTDFPAGVAHGRGQWNTIQILRQGSNIKIYVNGYLAVNLNDSAFTGNRKFGVDLNSRDLNNNNNPLKIRFDNVRVKQLP